MYIGRSNPSMTIKPHLRPGWLSITNRQCGIVGAEACFLVHCLFRKPGHLVQEFLHGTKTIDSPIVSRKTVYREWSIIQNETDVAFGASGGR